jgi:uncharacterized protein with PIN domain
MSAEPDRATPLSGAEQQTPAVQGVRARFHFERELNDLLAPARRGLTFEYPCARAATVKNAIESLGVPHTEVGLVLVNGTPSSLGRPVAQGDFVEVLPIDQSGAHTSLNLPQPVRFVADAHLGGLARLLRMLGYDTVFRNDLHDDEIRSLAAHEGRVVLSRDRELLKCKGIAHGCFVRALKPQQQLREVVERLQLASGARPFTLCLHCNQRLQVVDKADVCARLPENAARFYQRFCTCPQCERVFWEGSHWRRMRGMLEGLGLPAEP